MNLLSENNANSDKTFFTGRLAILNYTPVFLPNIGGIEQNIYYFALHSKHRHSVLTDHFPATPLNEVIEGINIYRVPPARLKGRMAACKVANALLGPIRDFNKLKYIYRLKYDIFHMRAPYLSPDLFFVIDHWLGGTYFKRLAAWRFSKKPRIVTFHMLPSCGTLTQNLPIPYPQSVKQRKSWIAMEKLLCEESAAVICVDKFMVDELSKTVTSGAKIHYIPSAIDNKIFSPLEKSVAFKLLPPEISRAIPKNDFTILYLGRFDPVRGSQFLFQLAQMLPQGMKLVIAGGGNLHVRTSRNQILLGTVKNTIAPLLINACDAVFNPVMVKGTSRATFEAMACGKPVIMFGKGQDRYPLINNENGFLVRDLDEAVCTLSKLMNEGNLYKRISHSALCTSKKYSILNAAKQIDLVYDTVGFDYSSRLR